MESLPLGNGFYLVLFERFFIHPILYFYNMFPDSTPRVRFVSHRCTRSRVSVLFFVYYTYPLLFVEPLRPRGPPLPDPTSRLTSTLLTSFTPVQVTSYRLVPVLEPLLAGNFPIDSFFPYVFFVPVSPYFFLV